jgi:hypothetical protein
MNVLVIDLNRSAVRSEWIGDSIAGDYIGAGVLRPVCSSI